MSPLGGLILGLLPLDVLPPTPTGTGPGTEVYPGASNGFAAYLIGGFVGLGVLVVAMILLSRQPRRANPDGPNRTRGG